VVVKQGVAVPALALLFMYTHHVVNTRHSILQVYVLDYFYAMLDIHEGRV